MKNITTLFIFSLFSLLAPAQSGQWVWIHGSDTSNALGTYGIEGVSGPANNPPSVYEPCEWTDKKGNFWLFGGLNTVNDGCYPDLWKYDPVINEWTWMSGDATSNDPGNYGVQGVSSPTNQPPATSWGAASWVDANGNLWMFGGMNYYDGEHSDMWKYDLSSGEWTWMKGPGVSLDPGFYGVQGVPNAANNPSARAETAAAWTDAAGDLWLFGGSDGANDVWRFNVASNNWTWMKGDSAYDLNESFGTQGIESPLNNPPGNWAYSRWKDGADNFWIFGVEYNGLFRFNPGTNNWTWVNGNSSNLPGVYGTECVPAALNNPPPRTENRAAWTDVSGNFWMFGGTGFNDLWTYRVSTNEWTWVSGDTIADAPGNWGTMGVYSLSNMPSGRKGSVAWVDGSCHLYLFGGCDDDYSNYFNDLWQYTMDSSCGGGMACLPSLPAAMFTSNNSNLCANNCISFTNNSANATSWQWNFAGAADSISTAQNPQGVCYLTPGIYNVTLVASNSTGSDTLRLNNYITVNAAPPVPVVTQVHNDTLFCSTNVVYASYQWYRDSVLISGATDTFLVISGSGNYNVVVSNENGCKISEGINIILGVQNYMNDNTISLFPNPATDKLYVTSHKLIVGGVLNIYNVLGEMVLHSPLLWRGVEGEADVSSLSSGLYFVQLVSANERWVGKFVKE